jgi:hypothetical protein
VQSTSLDVCEWKPSNQVLTENEKEKNILKPFFESRSAYSGKEQQQTFIAEK